MIAESMLTTLVWELRETRELLSVGLLDYSARSVGSDYLGKNADCPSRVNIFLECSKE